MDAATWAAIGSGFIAVLSLTIAFFTYRGMQRGDRALDVREQMAIVEQRLETRRIQCDNCEREKSRLEARLQTCHDELRAAQKRVDDLLVKLARLE